MAKKPAQNNPPPALPGNPAESITVASQIDGFRRGGIAWSRTPTTIALEDLSEAQIVAIAAEPLLDVVFNAAPAAE